MATLSVSVPADRTDRRWTTRITNWRVRTPGPATYEKGLAHPACVSARPLSSAMAMVVAVVAVGVRQRAHTRLANI